MQLWQTTIRVLSILALVAFASCSGSGSSAADPETPAVEPTPDFTPDADQSLGDLVINTFKDNGIDITMTGEDGDAFLEFGTLEKDDELAKSFTLTNGTSETFTFSFQMYSISSGFSVLDEDQQAFGTWNELALAPGESRTFYLKFNAYYFGTQTSYLTVTAKEQSGFIYFPFRAAVQGAADVRVISSAYMCTDEDVPQITSLDFLKVASGNTFTKSFKICNSGGEDIVLNSINIENANNEILSDVFDEENALEQYFDWSSNDVISAEFASGFTPAQLDSFTAPVMLSYEGSIDNPAGSYGITDHNNGSLSSRTIAAGSYLLMDVAFKPELAVEADEGSLYEPVAFNALLNLDTSLGVMEVNLLGATSGEEPVLAMTYRAFSYTEVDGVKTVAYDDLLPQTVDLSSDSPAVLFGTAKVFTDGWVFEDERRVEVTIKNAGTGSKALRVFAQNPTGFFAFGDENSGLSVPFSPNDDGAGLAPGEEKTVVMVYHPTPATLEDAPADDESYWDFGQLYLQHTGGNGPYAKAVLVGDEESGLAVEFSKGGTLLAAVDTKSFCAMATKASEAGVTTSHTFTVVNNSPGNTLSFTYAVVNTGETGFTATPQSSTAAINVAPGASSSFTIDFVADAAGSVSGTVSVTSSFPESTKPDQQFIYTLNFTASGLDSGECEFDAGVNEAAADANGKSIVTFVSDRITMIMTKLAEPTRNLAPFKFQLPFEIDKEAGTVRLAKDVPFKAVYEKPEENDPTLFMRSYAHQATGMTGCAPLPSNPYKLEYEAGSWTGEGYTCAVQDLTGPDADYGSMHMIPSATCMDNNAGEYYTNEDATKSIIFYHDFAKMDTGGSCEVKLYGRIANFAYNPDKGESISSIFKLSEEKPNESEAYYEELYGAYRYDSYITFNANTTCGNKTYTAGTTITAEQDPQAIKDCYQALASDSDNNRAGGMIDECSYFNFNVEAGVEDPNCLSHPDDCIAYGPYEEAVDPNDPTKTLSTQYDLTLYNIKMQVFVLNLGDKTAFFSHPGHLLYSDLYVTFTTKRIGTAVAEMNSGDSSWQDLIAVNTRADFTKNQIFVEDDKFWDVQDFWDDGQINSEFTNKFETQSSDGSEIAGVDKGVFRWVDKDTGEISSAHTAISHAGWPINYDDRNLGVIVGLGSFHGKGNTAPIFTKEDSSGVGNPLYFALHGCLYNGQDHDDVLAGQGCQSSELDAKDLIIPEFMTFDADGDEFADEKDIPNDVYDASHPDTKVLDKYTAAGMLPNGYIEDGNPEPNGYDGTPIQCSDLSSIDPIVYIDGDDDEDETIPDDWDIYYRYMSCVNFTIFPTDRNRYTNYYIGSNFFFDKDYYSNTACGYGM